MNNIFNIEKIPLNFLEKIPENFLEKINSYYLLISKWNKKINLIADLEKNNFFDRHIVDSLQLISFIKLDQPIIDLGSGAGFPGVILSLAGVKKMSLVESVRKKAVFLKEASFLSDFEIDIFNERVENLNKIEAEIITARGFASINKIMELTDNIRKDGQKYVLLKGKKYLFELQEMEKKYNFSFSEERSITDEEGRIIIIENVTKK